MAPLCFAYYCSGHGYGHATRVSAFTCCLLALPPEDRPIVHIVSSAPERVFADSIARGALYRYAEIDPIIVQPLAYRVDRQKSVDVLKLFLLRKDLLLEVERQWLVNVKAQAVLSDAAFLGCLAATAAGIPSILITNFTFDSVYSYLSTPVTDPQSPQNGQPNHLTPSPTTQLAEILLDVPVPSAELEPLVAQIYAGYRCAELLLLLPGSIPIPSFSIYPPLPSRDWVDAHSNTFRPEIIEFLSQYPGSYTLNTGIPFSPSLDLPFKDTLRSIIPAPLLVRPPTTSPSVYTAEGRSRLLLSIGVPLELHDPSQTKVLVVSFGGQVFRKPSRSGSRSQSRNSSRGPSPDISLPSVDSLASIDSHDLNPPRLATPSHLWIPGAPPASKNPAVVTSFVDIPVPILATIPPTPNESSYFDFGDNNEYEEACLLPDSSWIAIVCGVSKAQWEAEAGDEDSGLPDGFFVAPRDVYMPDLTAAADVLLGKLGYGTVSECVDSCTPFVYVSRPLFIEEHGLRLLLGREGVGVELSRHSYEAGDWADAVEEAWARGREARTKKREDFVSGIGLDRRAREGSEMARTVIGWTRDWWGRDATAK